MPYNPQIPLSRTRQEHYQNRMNTESQALRELQKKIATLQQQQQKLETQKQENEMVEHELGMMEAEAQVYKLIGPVLVSQDPEDAKAIITKRLEYIRRDLGSVEGQINKENKEYEKKKEAIAQIQTDFQNEIEKALREQQK
eukprot:Sspe_Gene.89192::Locus_61017_Transcript_1_1_Confidence_1.000_Length_610::g.89192::m.89192/K04798/pfdB, PFDN6; prefoldin beta subunit